MTKEDIKAEEYSQVAVSVWQSNQEQAKKIAQDLFAKHQLPPAAPILIANLAALLADLQRLSFLHGVAAVLYASEAAMDVAAEVIQ